MMLKKTLFSLIVISVLCSCEHFVGYDEYIINKSNEDVIIYIPSVTAPYHKLNIDSVIIKKNHRLQILEYGKINGYEVEFSECIYPHNMYQFDSVFTIRKVNDTAKSYMLNDRSYWIYERVKKNFKSFDCECTYVITEQDFE